MTNKIKKRMEVSNRLMISNEKYNPDDNPPRFSFKKLMDSDIFGWQSLDNNHKLAFANTLYNLSQRTWAELRILPRHGLGYEKINRTSLKLQLPKNIPTESNIISFRFKDKASMIG